MSGKLVVFEGIDGSGKSTQFQLICDRLSREGIAFKRIVFPRYEQPSSALIRMYLSGEFGTDPDAVNAYAASSFFAVDRYASFVQDWRGYFDSGGLIMTDRYTSSNALHQGAKMAPGERERFFDWLYDFEFNLFGLPEPVLTFYMNIDVPLAAQRLAQRCRATDTGADIHELDLQYLENSAQSGKQAAARFGWYIVECVKDSQARTPEDLHSEIYSVLQRLLDTRGYNA